MSIMELRARITIPGIHVSAEETWGPLIARLERECEQYGPVLSWDDADTAVITMSGDVSSRRVAAMTFYDRVGNALADERIDAYPATVQVEPVDELPAAA